MLREVKQYERGVVLTMGKFTGVRNPDQGIMTYQQGYGKRIWLPVWAFLLRNGEHTILVDSGLDENELIKIKLCKTSVFDNYFNNYNLITLICCH